MIVLPYRGPPPLGILSAAKDLKPVACGDEVRAQDDRYERAWRPAVQ